MTTTGGSMPSSANSVTIDRPAGDVFQFLADPQANDKKWRPAVIEMRHLSGDGAGARYHQKMKGPVGMKISADIEIEAFGPAPPIPLPPNAGPGRPGGPFENPPAADGCKLAFPLSVELTGGKKVLMG